MNITQITVGWQQTQSLPEYSNIKPSIALTAQLQDGDNVDEVIAQLRDQARDFVQEHIDSTLEQHDLPAKYSRDARFDVYVHGRGADRIAVVVPIDMFHPKQFYRAHSNHRIGKAINLAQTGRGQGTQLKLYLSAPFDELTAIDDALDAAHQAREAERQAAWERRNNRTLPAPVEEEDDEEEEDEEEE